MIKNLLINNFRNYESARLSLEEGGSDIVVLYGENGEGKTNVLEAISTFSELGGFKRSRYEEMVNNISNKPYWNIVLETEITEFSSGYIARENPPPSSGTTWRRYLKVGDKAVRNLTAFYDENYILWLTYESDRLFMQSPSARRDFLDMLCCVRNKAHGANVKAYEKLTRERIKILKKCNEQHGLKKDIDSWLQGVENKISALGIEIADRRIDVVRELEESQLSDVEFPRFKNWMTGPLEDGIMTSCSECLVDEYVSELKRNRQKDCFSGSTAVGPNRSDWIVVREDSRPLSKPSESELMEGDTEQRSGVYRDVHEHSSTGSTQQKTDYEGLRGRSNEMPARLLSAGEQKMLLTGAFFAFVMMSLRADHRNLILLLDDVVAHLDLKHRTLIFGYVKAIVANYPNKTSVWLSGPERELFTGLEGEAEFFNIHDNNIERR